MYVWYTQAKPSLTVATTDQAPSCPIRTSITSGATIRARCATLMMTSWPGVAVKSWYMGANMLAHNSMNCTPE